MKQTSFKKQFVISGFILFLLLSLVGTAFAAVPVINDQTFNVAENSATGTFVGDVDPADSATAYAITAGNSSGAFTINPANGDITVLDGTQLDYETTPQFILTVEVTNADGSDTATITIDVINVNDAPEITPNQSFSVAENSQFGSSVGAVSASDPDPGNTLSYSIIAGNTGNAFMINPSTGEIQVQTSSALNFEVGPTTYDLIVSVTDGGLSDTDVVTIDVTDANDPPVADDDGPYAATEDTSLNVDAANGVLNGDADEDGDGITAVLDTQPANGSVTLNSDGSFTYDPDPGFDGTDTFTYHANDGTDDSNTATVTIEVSGTNDAPTANDDTFGPVDEDSILNESALGVLDNDSDPENDPLTVSSSDSTSAQGAAVSVNADGSFSYDPTGVAALQALPQGGSAMDTFAYTANDGNLDSIAATVTITVTGVNDAPTVSDDTFSVAEDAANGTSVGTPASNDPDAGDTLTFSILSGNTGNAFAINSATGEITVNDTSALDFETNPTVTLTIQVQDGSGATDTATVTINVTDANDAPTDISLDNASVPENSASGTAVGDFSTTDQDGDTFTYTLAAGTGDADNPSFQISGDQLQTAVVLDFETQSSYSIRVRSTDSGGLWFEKIFSISATDVNEAPTAISLDNSSVLEEQPADTAVGNFSTTDPDSGDTFTYSLATGAGDTGNGSFQIVGNQLQTAVVLDFEGQPSYSIRVRSTDGGGLSVEQTFTITVTNGNDAPTDIALSANTVDENQPSSTVVGVLNGTDPNAGDTLTFSLVSGAVDNSSFAVNGTNLETAVSFDFETQNSYTVRVRVTDQGGLYFDKDFTITINDVNDAPTDIALDNASIAENNSAGDLVGNFSTTDEDAGDTFTYVLTDTASFPDNASFTIVGGQLQASAVFDYEAQSSYSIRVRSVDSGGLWTEKTLTVAITDVNEPPTDAALDNNQVAENQPSGTTIGQFSATDPDSSAFTYSLPAGVMDNDNFTILNDTLYTNAVFDYEVQSSYTISVTVNDGLNDFLKAFTILITDANDAPTAVDDAGQTTDEDTALNVSAPGVLGNDTDPENDTLSVSSADSTSTQGAVVTVNADGSFSYDPTSAVALQALGVGESLNDMFNYTVSDGNGGMDMGMVMVQVTGVNDAPAAQDDMANTPQDTAVTINVRSNDTDPDTNDTLTIMAVTQGSKGSVTHNGSTVTYTPNAGEEGDDSFSYTIEDGNGGTATAVVDVRIGLYQLFLPVVINPGPAVDAPDLVVTNVSATNSEVQVTIRNQGNVATANGFWVDFYVDPKPVPTHANQLWDDLGSEGIAWGITIPINPGDSLTLIYSTVPGAPNTFVSADDTYFTGTMAAGTAVYAQADSAHVGHVNGAIEETHEILGEAYNNVSQMFTSTAAGAAADTAVSPAAEAEANFNLPVR